MALLTSVVCNALHQIELDECGNAVTPVLVSTLRFLDTFYLFEEV